ncbi:MAG: hypothetical protein QM664_03825 [Flavihumibacter sp.]
MYEKANQPLISRGRFMKRLAFNLFLSAALLAVSLLIGVVGFHGINGSSWIDSLHNASMLLGGMGPVVDMHNSNAKLFSSVYALFCGVIFITNIGLLLAPVVHRILHHFHVQNA